MTQDVIHPYKPKHHIRIVTAASLFDGHDAAINIMRRIIQSTGCEVIHLGHNRSVQEIVDCAIQEDAQAIAITSYQGGHVEYFKYMHDLLKSRGASQIKIFGGGGGTILPEEIKELHEYGITRIYSPDDGRDMGLQGMINHLVEQADFSVGENLNGQMHRLANKDRADIARAFECAVVDTLVIKCRRALKQEELTRLVMAGGVSANVRLRAALGEKLAKEGCEVFYPAPSLCTDNGAMIAYAGALRLAAGEADGPDAEVRPRWPMTDLAAPQPAAA